mmetsp:Transcript_26572/g.64134  ORF Transcript_26572/g.64134 Transcript_26572/m.64134 type:complete len:220 (+) Transcript_26572:57-716(+)
MGSEGKEGVLYACGEWEHGQLGLPWSRKYVVEGETKEYDQEVPSTGERTIGKNTLLPPIPAVDDKEKVSHPHVVPLLRSHHIVKASAGGDHSFVVTDAGRVFCCGKNDTFQLGVTSGPPQAFAATTRMGMEGMAQEGADQREVGPEPVQVVALRWKMVADVSCGDAHRERIQLGHGKLGEAWAGSLQKPPKPPESDAPRGGTPCRVSVCRLLSLPGSHP